MPERDDADETETGGDAVGAHTGIVGAVRLPAAAGWESRECWVRLTEDGGSGRWFIVGNAHTHRGHLYVESEDGRARTVHLADLADASPVARIWLSGFLQGQEPDLFEFLGSDEGLYDAYTGDDLDRWNAWNSTFRSTGWPARLEHLPTASPQLAHVAPPTPWVFVGGLYRGFDGGGWVAMDPQPSDGVAGGWALPGTVCAQRRHHRLAVIDEASICEDCHLVTAS